jgi:sugar O-acyltransferase (sialic acid O-acetyltransferase NeuD family)
VIVGSGGHAISLFETVIAAGYTMPAYFDPDSDRSVLLDRPVLSEFPSGQATTVLAIGDNYRREAMHQDLLRNYPHLTFPSVVHPSASVATTATVGEGSVVMQGAVIGACATIGRFCIVSTCAAIAHETQLADYSSALMRATLAGQVHLGHRSSVSMSASVRQGMSIGPDTIIGAHSLVNADIPARSTAWGIPATVRTSRNPGDRYL